MGWADQVRHFSPDGDPALRDAAGTTMDERLMVLLDQARDEAGVPFRVTSGYRPPGANVAAGGASDSAHLDARAVDGFFEGWSLFESFVHLVRFPFFAVGLYPYPLPGHDPKTYTPVVHIDRKDRGHPYNAQVFWVRNAAGVYVYWPTDEFTRELRALAAATR